MRQFEMRALIVGSQRGRIAVDLVEHESSPIIWGLMDDEGQTSWLLPTLGRQLTHEIVDMILGPGLGDPRRGDSSMH
jgi:hypothetical protein